MTPSPRNRIAVVDLLRTLSIVAVLAVHVLGAIAPGGPGWSVFDRFARNGAHGVTVFFVVSGFVITETVLRWIPDPRRMSLRWFYVRRLGRVLPLMAMALLVGGLLAWASSPSPTTTALRNPAAEFDIWFFASFPTFSFNWVRIVREPIGFGLHWDVFWSLAIEEQFYLLFPLLLRAFGLGRRLVILLVGFVVMGVAYRLIAGIVFPTSYLWVVTGSFAAFDQLAIGVLAALASRSIGTRPAPWAPLAALGGLILMAVPWCTTHMVRPGADRVWPQTVIALGTAALIVGGSRLRALDRTPRALRTPGQLSYGMYLWHSVVLFALWDFLLGSKALPVVTVYLLAVVGVASVSFRWFEQPVNRFIRARWAGPALRAEPMAMSPSVSGPAIRRRRLVSAPD